MRSAGNSLDGGADVERALTELGRRMTLCDADHVEVVCCGAAALCMLGVLQRRTLDVDAVGTVGPDGEIGPPGEISAELESAIESAGRALGLSRDWFNFSSSLLLARGLPAGTLKRSSSHMRRFGPCLTVRFMDRLDLVALKMFAALDPDRGRRHMEDLVAIAPSKAELRHGAEWMTGWTSGRPFKDALRNLLAGFDSADLLP